MAQKAWEALKAVVLVVVELAEVPMVVVAVAVVALPEDLLVEDTEIAVNCILTSFT